MEDNSLDPPDAGRELIWVARFDRGLGNVTVYLNEMLINRQNGNVIVSNPVRYPMDQILLMYLLAQREGVLIHAAGIDIRGKGYIFPGRSGAGKSIFSRQFVKAKKCADLLSDDRIIVKKIDGAFKTFGTPWPGQGGIAINKHVALSGIFFISHAGYNRIEKLLPVVLIPWYDKEVMTSILTFCDDIISNIPVYELFFKPDREIIDVFEKFVSNII